MSDVWDSGQADDGAWKDDDNNDWKDENGTTSYHGGDGNKNYGGNNDKEACHNCGEKGHLSRECPEPKKLTGECFNCGEIGHNKADCHNPHVARPFAGECRRCKEVGHLAADCPQKTATICKNCLKEGHLTSECKDARVLAWDELHPEWDAVMSWTKLVEADKEKDLDDFRLALKAYASKVPTTFAEVEAALREDSMNVYLVGLEKEVAKALTLVDLQGNIDRKYTVGFYFSPKPRRANAAEAFPKTPEENMERLQNAGFAMDRRVPKCDRCGELGHITKSCPQEPEERIDRVEIKCAICEEVGHRARDCKQERVDPFMCRNCKQSGHKASECPNPKDLSDVECKRCNKMGHFAKDCDEERAMTCRNCGEEGHIAKECKKPRNMDTVTCRNCDETGHYSRDCPKPRDYSRVQCSNCQEYGHTRVRCPKPVEDDNGGAFETNGGVELNANTSIEAVGGWKDNADGAGADDQW